jgi:hypothetical protein
MINPLLSSHLGEAPSGGAYKTIPFDYSFRLDLEGIPQKVHRRIVTVSVEATFIAVSVGYGVIPRVPPIIFGPKRIDPDTGEPVAVPIPLRDITIGDLIDGLRGAFTPESENFIKGEGGAEAVLKNGIKLNSDLAERALVGIDEDEDPYGTRAVRLEPSAQERLFQVVGAPPEQIQFLYALFDDATGREFQSTPVLNTAGLGNATGDRPFYYFARPIIFAPRSTIRMEVTEVSAFSGELYISLNGYKMLGAAGTPTGARAQQSQRRLTGRFRR